MPKFIPGLKLSKLFYETEVRPILNKEFPKLPHSAALIGWGSEVLGFDTALSRDHHWGPRLLLFLSSSDYRKLKDKICQALSNNLPYEFMGYSTNYGKPDPGGVRLPIKITSGPVDHMINIYTVESFFANRLGVDLFRKFSVIDWLTFPQQRLLELTSGEVYHDGSGELQKAREKLKFYPKDVWLYLLAAHWMRISQEEAFVGRAGDVGDELGSQILAARIVREIMKLAFLMERQYAPYGKWFGSAFRRLKISAKLTPVLRDVLLAKTWRAREQKLAHAYSLIARQHNSLKITEPLRARALNYYERPYRVIQGDRFADEILKAIKDPDVKRVNPHVGSIDQLTDSPDITQTLTLRRSLGAVYEKPKKG